MELNEQNVVVEAFEDGASAEFGKGFIIGGLTTLAIGAAVKLVGKFVIVPLFKKGKAKKEKAKKDAWEEAKETLDEVRENDED